MVKTRSTVDNIDIAKQQKSASHPLSNKANFTAGKLPLAFRCSKNVRGGPNIRLGVGKNGSIQQKEFVLRSSPPSFGGVLEDDSTGYDAFLTEELRPIIAKVGLEALHQFVVKLALADSDGAFSQGMKIAALAKKVGKHITQIESDIEKNDGSTHLKPPLPKLTISQINDIKQRGIARPWEKRKKYRMDVFKWVSENYSEWIPGLTQSHLKSADILLYGAFTTRVSRGGLPEWLDVPSESEANLRRITDPAQRAKLLRARELKRDGMRITRTMGLA